MIGAGLELALSEAQGLLILHRLLLLDGILITWQPVFGGLLRLSLEVLCLDEGWLWKDHWRWLIDRSAPPELLLLEG